MNNQFFERLQEVAMVKNKVQADLVNDLAKDSATISRWWNGQVVPGPRNMRLLADYLGCDVRWLATGAGEPFAGVVRQTTTASGHAIAISGQQVGAIELNSGAPAADTARTGTLSPQESALFAEIRKIPEPFRQPFLDKFMKQIQQYRRAIEGE